jgi:hypothetical protein
MRKTIDVADIVDMVNRRLEQLSYSPSERYAFAALLEEILHQTGNYKGYVCFQDEDFGDSRRRYVK